MVYKNTDIRLTVASVQSETPGYRSVLFERPRGFTFEAGDWIDIDFVGRELQGGKTYSLSSSPTETDLMITFREGVSPFKRALATAEAGDELRVTQYGNDYDFHLQPHRASVLIAGGVGIAPFRSMLKAAVDTNDRSDIVLIYQNKTDDFLFLPELDHWQQVLPNLQVIYVATDGLKKKERLKILRDSLKDTDGQYFVAGPEGMVSSMLAFLLELGIQKKAIRVDSFGGY